MTIETVSLNIDLDIQENSHMEQNAVYLDGQLRKPGLLGASNSTAYTTFD